MTSTYLISKTDKVYIWIIIKHMEMNVKEA